MRSTSTWLAGVVGLFVVSNVWVGDAQLSADAGGDAALILAGLMIAGALHLSRRVTEGKWASREKAFVRRTLVAERVARSRKRR